MLTNLNSSTTYFVRSYATISISYGTELSFTTLPYSNNSNLNDTITYGVLNDCEGNVYATIQIGNQTWMAENLKSTKFSNCEDIIPNLTIGTEWTSSTTTAWCS